MKRALLLWWVLTSAGPVACSTSEDEPQPGRAGEPCNIDAPGTDGCNATSVCVFDQGYCYADCDQESCPDGNCLPYTSPYNGLPYDVCTPLDAPAPGVEAPGNGQPSVPTGQCQTTAAQRNQAARQVPGSEEIPGQFSYSCPGGTPNQAAPGPDCGLYCSQGGVCCAPQGHPELSCPFGSYCTSSGACASSASCADAPTGLGLACSTHAECVGTNPVLLCMEGACRVREGAGCAQDAWCGPGVACRQGVCRLAGSCDTSADCAGGLVCSASGACVPGQQQPGGGNCSTGCVSSCTGNVPEQACFYCQAACLCACAGESGCAQQNRQYAQELGTTCPQ